jgi:CDP-6-deoxy-D-xylo-4-hexulose-3-dehydrase
MSAEALRAEILRKVAEYYQAQWPARPFEPGTSPVPVSGKVFDERDLQSLVDASLDFWLTTGRFAQSFESRFAAFMEQKHCLLVNSGSSANLLAITTLTAQELGERRLNPGDEVITCATGFPTTVNPILQNQLVPVYLDVQIPSYNMDLRRLEEAIGPRTKAIVLAHTLGNPFDLEAVSSLAKKHGLWLVEDCCDAVGAQYQGRSVGTFGDLCTVSFYPAHHITMGEGGAVLTSNPRLKKLAESFRDWGRDCWCEPGCDNTCGKRFDWQLGELPAGYDHKFTYSRLGYNLKATDMQAAVGVSQLDKLPGFIERRSANFAFLMERLKPLQEHLILPESLPQARPSWFGLPLTLKEESPYTRRQLIAHLDARRIGTRLLFGGNLLRQPAYQGTPRRVVGELSQADRVMERTFWIGVHPGLDEARLEYLADALAAFLR